MTQNDANYMKFTKISSTIQKSLNSILEQYPLVSKIVTAIDQCNGKAILVGGAVRDLLLNLKTKDLDIEVHGLELKDLEAILKKFGDVSLVGKVFGVLRLHGLDVDWSLPRADSPGRKPEVAIDPFMGFEDAFRRRDLTINAMGIDLKTHELIDPFGGARDLEQEILRAPDEKFFIEDPLRLYRVMQFIGRFEMEPDEQLNVLCKRMDITGVSRERIEEEFAKLFLKSRRPSFGIEWLREIGRLQEILPELAAIIGVPQDPQWHPEGDVFEHTMQAIDVAAALTYASDEEKLIMIYAALCHDLGKLETTEEIDGRIKSLEHAQEGAPIAQQLLSRITNNKKLIEAVCKLVSYHMAPVQFITGHARSAAYKRLARKLAPEITLQQLAQLSLIDKRARSPIKGKLLIIDDPAVTKFLQKAQELNVLETVEEPVLLGRDLMDVVEPGPKMGELLKKAYEIQIEEGITDKEELKRRVLEGG